MKILPNSRTKDIVVQNISKETLVYDLTNHKAYNLSETSSIVFNACDGKTSFNQLKRKHNFTDDLIHLALAELKSSDLIADYESSHFAGLSRREVIKKVGFASMIALPVIVGITAPTAASAQSACVNTTGPQRARNTFLGYRSPDFCANDAFTCCSNSTRYNPDDSIEINNVTHQRGYACYCN